jgi:hypothetical protein
MPRIAPALALLIASLSFGEPSLLIRNDGSARTNAIVFFNAREDLGKEGTLTGPGGLALHFQKMPGTDGYACVLPKIEENAELHFSIQKRPSSLERVKAENTNGAVKFSQGQTALFTYQGEPSELPRPDIKPLFKRGGYLHPVYSPSGLAVTDDYPPNHIHHHGIWMPWTKTEFEGRHPDFWNMGDGKGKVEFVRLLGAWSGPVIAGFESEHRFVDLTAPTPKAALDERWKVASYGILDGSVPANVFDLESIQSTASESPLKLPKYYYGGLGFRGNWAWNGMGKTFFLSSEGVANRTAGNETRANWCYIGGEINGRQTGLVIMCHPENFRAPQPMRWHPYEPFFCYAPSQLGDWEIKPGERYISRYRFLIFDGKPDREWINQAWLNYARPVQAAVQ